MNRVDLSRGERNGSFGCVIKRVLHGPLVIPRQAGDAVGAGSDGITVDEKGGVFGIRQENHLAFSVGHDLLGQFFQPYNADSVCVEALYVAFQHFRDVEDVVA